eukprot:jgi/Tetstr1/431012/TSEL_002030.t1
MARKRGRPQIALPPAKAPTLDPEGAPDGPKRTPISFADAYNGREAYKVEKILAQVTRKGVEHYIVRWEGLCDKADTMEPASHLEDDESLEKIDEFLEARRALGVGRPSAKRPNTVSDPGSSSIRSLPQDGLTSDEATNAQELKLLIRSPCAAPAAAANRRATVQPRKSIVWNYFSKKFRGEDGYLYSTYSLCRTTMAFCNTTTVINHLIRKHSDDLVDDAMGGKIALKAIFKKDAGGVNKPAPVAEAVKFTKLPDDVKRDYDAAAVKWIVKSCMPHSITERDQYLREFLKMILEMSVENILQLKEEIEDLQKERLSVSLAADIWGENGISILAIMAYWITPDFELKEKLLLAKPFSQVKGISAHFNRSSKGWRKLEEVAAQQRVKGIIYGPVAQMLTMMEATSVPTFSCVLPMFGSLHAAMDEDATAMALIDSETTGMEMEVWESRNTFKDSIQRRILSNNPSYTEDALTATALDPRWKNFDFPGAGRLMRADAYNYLRGAYKDDWAPPAPSITPAPVAPASKRTAFNAAPVKKAKLSRIAGMQLLLRTVDQDNMPLFGLAASAPAANGASVPVPSTTQHSWTPAEVLATQMKEVEEYLKLPQVIPINDDGTDFDLLAWWKARQTIFPHLSKMARQFHAFPATSAGVERLFCATGRMHNDFKKSTSETTLEHALIVYKNLD